MDAKKAIILSRVSTYTQDLSQQTDAVREVCHKDGYKDEDIIVIEQKESAVKLNEEQRLSLNELKSAILNNEGIIGCVYAYEISRIGRRAEVNYSIRNFLQEHRVQLVILKPEIRLFDDNFKINESANMTFAIFNALAENEGYLRKERTMRGIRKAQAEGRAGTGKVPFGYSIEPKTHRIIINEEEADVVRKLFDMYANQGYSTVMLARYFHETGEIPTRVTVLSMCRRIGKMLSNPAYIGGFPMSSRSDGKQVRNLYPRIISDEIYDKVQAIKLSNFNGPKRATSNIYFCKGILYDKKTMQKFVPRIIGGCYFFTIDDFKTRRNISIPINLLDSVVWHVTKEYRLNHMPISVVDIIKTAKKEKVTLQKRVSNAKRRIQEYEEEIIKINERIVKGKIKEVVGDAMINQREGMISTLKTQFVTDILNIHSCDERIKKYTEGLIPVSLDDVVDDKERLKIIHECIDRIEAVKAPEYKPGTTDIIIHFENKTFLIYQLNSYSRTCYDCLKFENVEFEYMPRIDYYQYRKKQSKKNK